MTRLATSRDLNSLCELYTRKSIKIYLPYRNMQLSQLKEMLLAKIEMNHIYVKANERGVIVASCLISSELNKKRVLLSPVIDLLNQDSIKHGANLLKKIIYKIKKKEQAELVALCEASINTNAIKIYGVLGFKKTIFIKRGVKKSNFFNTKYFDRILMCLELKAIDSKPIQCKSISPNEINQSSVIFRKAEKKDLSKIAKFCFNLTLIPNFTSSRLEDFYFDIQRFFDSGHIYVCENNRKEVLSVALTESSQPPNPYIDDSHEADFFVGLHPGLMPEISNAFVKNVVSNIKKITNFARLESSIIDGDNETLECLLNSGFKKEGIFKGNIKAIGTSHRSDVYPVTWIKPDREWYQRTQALALISGFSTSIIGLISVSIIKAGAYASTVPFLWSVSLALIALGGCLLLGEACYFSYQKWFFKKTLEFKHTERNGYQVTVPLQRI